MVKVNQNTYCIAIAHLIDFPATAHEIADVTGLHIITAQNFMACFLKHKIVHISAWETDRFDRDCTPVFTFGNGTNKPRRRRTRAQIASDYRDRKRNREIGRALVGQGTYAVGGERDRDSEAVRPREVSDELLLEAALL